MGILGAPFYGLVDLGSAVETAESVLAKIKTNRFDKDDLVQFKNDLAGVVAEIEKALAND